MKPEGPLNDFANILSPSTRDSLIFLSQSLWEKTKVPLILVTVKDLNGEDINEIANKLYEKWGIGEKGKDEGVLVILSVNDRQIRIETGYGTESYIPDAVASRILREISIPALSRGMWGVALKNTNIALASIIAKAHNVPLSSVINWDIKEISQKPYSSYKINPLYFLILFFILLFLLSTRTGRNLLLLMLISSINSGGRSNSSFGGGFSNRGFGGFGGGMSGGGGAFGKF